MRLLHFDRSDRLVLTDFRGKTVPPYAILSHRWGESEVIFQDLGSEIYKEKDSYRKLKFCAKQAAQDGLQYFWVDTCCIDKWNVRERSRAINSMFRWYKEATRCYVHLLDVSVPLTAETYQQRDWEASFRASKWFTRGWTLQELLAPVSVEFFSFEGRRLGDKSSLEQLVHEITSIPLAALRNCPLDQFTLSERMQWAKNRNTTEEEDKVYCLLGLLGVSMPTNYDEGKETALRRLQAEVEAASSAPCIIPFSQNDHFVGRELQLAELEAKLFSNKQTTTLAIVGPGGTGKTQLALELAHKTRQKNKNCSVFWIDAHDMDSLNQSYEGIAQKLHVPGWDDEKADVKQLVKLYLERKGATQCLLLFDNLDMNLGSGWLSTTRAADLIDYLPQSELCSIVFTTTSSDTAKMFACQNVIELQGMMSDTAQRMLELYLSPLVSESEQQEAKLLLQELSYLPLAIVQAAAYIKNEDITLQKYRSLLDEQKEQAVEHSSQLSENKLQGHGTTDPVAATLFISIDQIPHHNMLAVAFLFLAACVDRKDISLDLLEAPSPMEREDAIKVLSRYALVTRRPADSALDIHRLVHRALREWLQKLEWLSKWTHYAIAQLRRVFPDNDLSSRSKWRRLLPHAKYALSHSLPSLEDSDRLNLAHRCSKTLYSDGRYKEAEELEVQVLEIIKGVLGEEHEDTLSSMGNLATTYKDQGRWKEAEELGVQVIEVQKRVLGEDNPSTLISIGNLASTYRKQGRWKEAEELQVQVLATSRRVLGEEHPDTLIFVSNLASTYKDQGRWKEAEELQVQVLATSRRVLGEEHQDTLASMSNVALTYSDRGRWKEAEELQAKALEVFSRVLGEEHPDTLISIANLASTYSRQRRWKEAEELQARELEICSRVLGEEHPHTLTSTANLALTYSIQGRWKEAEELQAKELEICSRVLGGEHPQTLTSTTNLALTYGNQERWKDAEELQVRVLAISKRVLGEEHLDTLMAMGSLALTLKAQGRNEEAILLFETSMQLHKEKQERAFEMHNLDTELMLDKLTKWRKENMQDRHE